MARRTLRNSPANSGRLGFIILWHNLPTCCPLFPLLGQRVGKGDILSRRCWPGETLAQTGDRMRLLLRSYLQQWQRLWSPLLCAGPDSPAGIGTGLAQTQPGGSPPAPRCSCCWSWDSARPWFSAFLLRGYHGDARARAHVPPGMGGELPLPSSWLPARALKMSTQVTWTPTPQETKQKAFGQQAGLHCSTFPPPTPQATLVLNSLRGWVPLPNAEARFKWGVSPVLGSKTVCKCLPQSKVTHMHTSYSSRGSLFRLPANFEHVLLSKTRMETGVKKCCIMGRWSFEQ